MLSNAHKAYQLYRMALDEDEYFILQRETHLGDPNEIQVRILEPHDPKPTVEVTSDNTSASRTLARFVSVILWEEIFAVEIEAPVDVYYYWTWRWQEGRWQPLSDDELETYYLFRLI